MQHHRRTYASIKHMHAYTHIYTYTHMCTQPAAIVFADVYVGVKTHLCNIHTCPCTSAQNTCSKVHETLTAKKCTYIYLHTYVYAYICRRKHMRMHDTVHTCACMTPSERTQARLERRLSSERARSRCRRKK